jgi:hypothetical protein
MVASKGQLKGDFGPVFIFSNEGDPMLHEQLCDIEQRFVCCGGDDSPTFQQRLQEAYAAQIRRPVASRFLPFAAEHTAEDYACARSSSTRW